MPDQNGPCPDDMEPASPGLLTFDYETAAQEGWTICQTDPHPDGTPCVVLALLLTPASRDMGFRSVDDVRRYVAQQAQMGSCLHIEALTLVDLKERFVIATLCEH